MFSGILLGRNASGRLHLVTIVELTALSLYMTSPTRYDCSPCVLFTLFEFPFIAEYFIFNRNFDWDIYLKLAQTSQQNLTKFHADLKVV